MTRTRRTRNHFLYVQIKEKIRGNSAVFAAETFLQEQREGRGVLHRIQQRAEVIRRKRTNSVRNKQEVHPGLKLISHEVYTEDST